jgi:chromosome segregation ATPase
MSTNSDKLLELLLSELRKNNDKIDDIDTKFDKKFDDINEKFDKKFDEMDVKFNDIKQNLSSMNAQLAIVMTKTDQMGENIKETRKDVEHLEHIVKGNGSPGLKTRVEVMDNKQTQLAQSITEIKDNIKNFNVEEKKESTAIKVAIIGGAISGFVALIKDFF